MIVFGMFSLIYLKDSGLKQIHLRYFALLILLSIIMDIAWLVIFTNVKYLILK